jgi:hypothetical protein
MEVHRQELKKWRRCNGDIGEYDDEETEGD